MTAPDPWPLRHLVLRTPRLELRPDDDAGLMELAALAVAGIHPPDQMPFSVPWTDAEPQELMRSTLRHHWRRRAEVTPQEWTVNFLARAEGRVVGTQSIAAAQIAVTREVSTGSWIGMAHQGRGIGTEMRAAVVMLAFDHLDATVARSSAYVDNVVSRRVSSRLGYVEDGTEALVRRGERVEHIRLALTPDRFVRPDWTLRVEGLDACRDLLGLG